VDPAPGDLVDDVVPVRLRGRISDTEDAPDQLAVVWTSDVSGELGTDPADAEGLAVAEVLLTAGAHAISLSVTDPAGLETTATLELAVNAAPSAPVIDLDPRPATTGDDLVLTFATESADEDGPDPVEHYIVWSRDGEPVSELFGELVVPDDATAKGQEWTVTVSGYDGQSTGPEVSDSVPVVNSPPVADVPALGPIVLTALSTAECTELTGTDADGDDVVVDVGWWIDGVDIGATGPTLSGAFTAGDSVQCVAIARDDEEAGVPVPSEAKVVENTLPGAPVLVITPLAPMTVDPLECTLSAPIVDPDGQPVSYDVTWLVDGGAAGISALGEDENFALGVPASSTEAGEEWTCEAVASDGDGQGLAGSTSVVIGCPALTGEASSCPGTSCRQILDDGFSIGDGPYWLDPAGAGAALFDCDMTTDGGGWTGVSFDDANTVLAGTMVAVDAAATVGIDPVDGPYTRDGSGSHTYHYTFDFPPGFDEFYLGGWVLKAWAAAGDTSDIYPNTFQQTDWSLASCAPGSCGTGDVGFGDAGAAGPVVSYASTLPANLTCRLCTTAFPAGSTVYSVGPGATQFRLGWGEAGGQAEGWYPWWDGAAYLR